MPRKDEIAAGVEQWAADEPRQQRATGAPSDDWNKFDVPGLRGIRRTAPYFHNNSAATLEEVVDHYMAFFNRVKALNAVPPPVATTDGIDFNRRPLPEEREALLAYLGKL